MICYEGSLTNRQKKPGKPLASIIIKLKKKEKRTDTQNENEKGKITTDIQEIKRSLKIHLKI